MYPINKYLISILVSNCLNRKVQLTWLWVSMFDLLRRCFSMEMTLRAMFVILFDSTSRCLCYSSTNFYSKVLEWRSLASNNFPAFSVAISVSFEALYCSKASRLIRFSSAWFLKIYSFSTSCCSRILIPAIACGLTWVNLRPPNRYRPPVSVPALI